MICTLFKGLGLLALSRFLRVPRLDGAIAFKANVPIPAAQYNCRRCHHTPIIHPDICDVKPSDPCLPIFFEARVRCQRCGQGAQVRFLPSGAVIQDRSVASRWTPVAV